MIEHVVNYIIGNNVTRIKVYESIHVMDNEGQVHPSDLVLRLDLKKDKGESFTMFSLRVSKEIQDAERDPIRLCDERYYMIFASK